MPPQQLTIPPQIHPLMFLLIFLTSEPTHPEHTGPNYTPQFLPQPLAEQDYGIVCLEALIQSHQDKRELLFQLKADVSHCFAGSLGTETAPVQSVCLWRELP